MIRRPPRSTQSRSSAASDVYKRQVHDHVVNSLRAQDRHAGQCPPVAVGELHVVLSMRASASSGPRRTCLLYTSDAADDLLCVDLGGRRIIKKKKKRKHI